MLRVRLSLVSCIMAIFCGCVGACFHFEVLRSCVYLRMVCEEKVLWMSEEAKSGR